MRRNTRRAPFRVIHRVSIRRAPFEPSSSRDAWHLFGSREHTPALLFVPASARSTVTSNTGDGERKRPYWSGIYTPWSSASTASCNTAVMRDKTLHEMPRVCAPLRSPNKGPKDCRAILKVIVRLYTETLEIGREKP